MEREKKLAESACDINVSTSEPILGPPCEEGQSSVCLEDVPANAESDSDCLESIPTSTPKTCNVRNIPKSSPITSGSLEHDRSPVALGEESDDSDWLEGIPTSTPKSITTKEISSNSSTCDDPVEITGRRIVDISFLLSSIQRCGNHTPFGCSFADMYICNERQIGMISEFTFVCKMCKKREKITTDDCSKDQNKLNLNTAMVSAITSIGQNYSQLEEVCCCLDMPCMSRQTFTKHQGLVDSAIHDCSWESMEEAACEEEKMARDLGSVDGDGVPEITVIVDGAWCKRSYKTNYNALSGVGCIIGLRTRKVLYIGVRNSYCCICARAQGKHITVPEHICYKNWTKSSTAMESDIIVEGFKKSREMYNLKYVNVIGDGDSSVMAKLKEAQPYGPSTTINKIECTNHLLRNYVRKLKEVSEQKRNEVGPVPGELRNKVKTNLLRLRYAVTGAVKQSKSKEELPMHDRIRELQEDIKNGPYHVFGDHSKCKSYFCSGRKEGELNLVEDLKTYGLWNYIMSANIYLTFFSFSLLQRVTTNLAECYNSIVCKFVAGKRVNFSQRNAYTTRSEMSALAMNEKEDANRKIYKKMTLGISPGKYFKTISQRRQKINSKLKKPAFGKPKKRHCLFPDKDYGDVRENIPDIDDDLFLRRKVELLKSLSVDASKRSLLEINSRGQSSCDLWVNERKKRLTASNFGKICKMRQATSCQKIVEQLLYKDFSGNSATRYGLEKEKIAIKAIEDRFGIEVGECGLYIDEEIPYLAASPDGIFSDKALVEVKCPAKAQAMTPEDAVRNKLITFCTLSDGQLALKRNHNYYYQIQGQLHIAKKQYCLFSVWTPLGMSVEKVNRDDDFWKENMEDKLISFYETCLLPEIIDPRHPRGLPIRDRV